MLELWLIRHGESLGNLDGSQADTDLSARGRQQSEALGQRLRATEFDQLLTSPLIRARQTAALALPDSEPIIDPRLRELVVPAERFLDVAGLGVEALAALLQEPAGDTETEVAETGAAFSARVRAFCDHLPAGGRVVAFTHFGVIRQILGQYIRFRDVPQAIAHCAVTQVHIAHGAARLVAPEGGAQEPN